MTSPLANAPGGPSIQTALTLSVTTTVKALPGAILQVAVLTTGSTVGSVYDSTGAATGRIAAIPNSVGTYDISFPCFVGITIAPGTGQVVSVSYQ